MEELWLRKDNLIPEREWAKEINSLKSSDSIKDKKEARKELKEKIILAIKKRIPQEKFGILFSGGVDSSLVAIISKKLKKDFVCYTVGFQDKNTKEPEDVIEAKKVAKKFCFKLKYKIYNLREIEKIIKKTVLILRKKNKVDVVNIGVGSVFLAAIGLGKKDKIDYFLSGLGSEEIFAGYERHKVNDINEECWQGLKKMWPRDLVRDFTLAKKLKAEIKTPFLDKELIEYAMKIPGEWKLNKKTGGEKEEKKIILREVAEEFLGKFAWRRKKAAQYGSGFDKALEKLARRKGFRSKKDYLESFK